MDLSRWIKRWSPRDDPTASEAILLILFIVFHLLSLFVIRVRHRLTYPGMKPTQLFRINLLRHYLIVLGYLFDGWLSHNWWSKTAENAFINCIANLSTTLSFSQEVACSADLQLHAPHWPEANKPHGKRLSHANLEAGLCEDILVDKVALGLIPDFVVTLWTFETWNPFRKD